MKPYLDVFHNVGEEISIVYINEVTIGERVEPQVLIVNPDHVEELITALQLAIQ